MEQQIKRLLSTIVHPESGRNIIESGIVEHVDLQNNRITVTLHFDKARDPFALKIKHQIEEILSTELALDKEAITVIIKEAPPRVQQPAERHTQTGGIGKILAVASGKGGVGKSTVTANLALTLRNMGYRVGILDADIYGPSQPKMFGVEDYLPEAERIDGEECILPADAMGIKLMSIGFFIKPTDALIWRDAMATNALRQMIHQTKWGGLDFLLIDLPPGTGGVHLAVISELKITGAVIVSTPQQVAVADVRRGVEMFRAEKNCRFSIFNYLHRICREGNIRRKKMYSGLPCTDTAACAYRSAVYGIPYFIIANSSWFGNQMSRKSVKKICKNPRLPPAKAQIRQDTHSM